MITLAPRTRYYKKILLKTEKNKEMTADMLGHDSPGVGIYNSHNFNTISQRSNNLGLSFSKKDRGLLNTSVSQESLDE
jgi:hypothetical protein